MAHDEFKIPQQYSEPEVRAQIDAIQNTATPKKESAPFQRIKDIEAQVFSYREAAMALNGAKKSDGRLGTLVRKPSHPSIAELIDAESYVVGKKFGPGHRFWLDNKHGSVFNNNIADWYHSQENPADPKHPTVLRFQATPYRLHKLYEGREYAPTVQEVETFVKAVELYAQEILPLYPLDQTINELKQEDQSSYDLTA